MLRTHVIIDGLQDPILARDLSARWLEAGFRNAVDIAGQAGWLERDTSEIGENGEIDGVDGDEGVGADDGDGDGPKHSGRVENETLDEQADAAIFDRALNEGDVARAGAIARAFGVEIRDRAGNSFVAANDPEALREQMVYEYRTRFAQSLVFGMPAIALHYLGPVLAVGGGESAGNMLYPWLIQMVLVGWALWAGGLPILWQGVMSAIHLRATADLLTTFITFAAFIPSVLGMVAVIFGYEPWFGTPVGQGGESLTSPAGPAFHIAMFAIMLALFQRWRLYKQTDRLSGRASLMMPRFNRLCGMWLVAVIITMVLAGWQVALGFGLVMPALLSVGGINRWSPGWSMALPVIAIAPLYLFGHRLIDMDINSVRVEGAVAFQLMMACVFAIGWSRWKVRNTEAADDGATDQT